MDDVSKLVSRIDAEFAALGGKIQKAQQEQLQQFEERKKRLRQFEELANQLRGVVQPRLEALKKRFGDEVKVQPRLTPTNREAIFEFQSSMARITLIFSASTDRDVRKLVLGYDLDIVPVLMQYERHAKAEFPLDKVDPEAVARWVDDRIVAFVQTYISLHENDYYLRDHMVEDPVVKVRFPKFAARCSLEWKGQTHYFIGEESRQEFARQNGIDLG